MNHFKRESAGTSLILKYHYEAFKYFLFPEDTKQLVTVPFTQAISANVMKNTGKPLLPARENRCFKGEIKNGVKKLRARGIELSNVAQLYRASFHPF